LVYSQVATLYQKRNGNLEYVPPKQIDKLWDKAVDKWGDWQAAQHIAKKYDDDGYLRKKK
jgi:hypothetical protein